MQTNLPSIRAVVGTILGVLALLGVVIFMWNTVGGKLPLQAKPYRVHVTLPTADALYDNNDVRMAGIKIGSIDSVVRTGNRADVTLAIDPEFVPLGQSTRAILRSKSLLGEGYLELAPGGGTSRATIPEGGRIPAANVQDTQQLDDVLQTFTPETRAKMRSMARGVAAAFGGRAGRLNDAIGRAAPLTANLQDVLDELRLREAPTRRLIANAGTAFTAAADESAVLRQAIVQGDRLLSVTGSRDRELSRTIDALPPFLDALKGAMAQLDSASGDLDGATRSLQPTIPELVPALRSLERDLPTFRRAFLQVRPPLRAAKLAFPAATRALRTSQPATAPTYQALRQAIPFIKLASTNKKAFSANFGILSSLFNATYIGSGQRPSHFPSAYLTAWNEIIGGFTKKLPSSTANPYPKPTAPEAFAKEGALRAYDCRNTGNAPIVPPFGSVPTCRTQGPWTFDGKTAYYPRLELDGP